MKPVSALLAALFLLSIPCPAGAGQAGAGQFVSSRRGAPPPICRRVMFFGDSITAQGNWKALFRDPSVINAGLVGDTTARAHNRLEWLADSRPRRLFIMLGINDVMQDVDPRRTEEDYSRILEEVRRRSPGTEVFVQSLLPVRAPLHPAWNKRVVLLNRALKDMAARHGARFVDLHPLFLAPDRQLDVRYAADSVHLAPAGYEVWRKAVEGYVRRGP